MNKVAIIAAFFALLLTAGHSAMAQSGYDLFQKGLVQERTEGNLDEAIKLYKQIVAEHKDDRALVAKALVQMGGCYEKLGRTEARKAYEQVIQEFADQSEAVRVARRQLEQLDAGAPSSAGNGPTYRLVLDEKMAGMPIGRWQEFSPSGDRIVFVSENKLYITDEAGAARRPLVDDLGPWEDVGFPNWSPDGKLIAYRLSRGVANDSGGDEILSAIFVIDPDGGAPRKISPDVRGRIRGASFWTPDSRNLSYWTSDGLYTFDLDGKEVRFIPKEDLPGVFPWNCVYSPNGRWLVSTLRKEGEGPGFCIVPAAGGTIRRIAGPLWGRPTWAPDGRTLYFVSVKKDYGPNIWKLPMDPETGLAAGEPQQVTFFRGTAIVRPKVLGDGSRIAFNMAKAATSIQVADASAPQEARSLVRSGRYAPELSPDGQTVYYVNDSPGEEGIYAVSRQGGTPRRLTENIPEKAYPHAPLNLSANGRTLAYVAELGEDRGIYTLAVSGGEPRFLVKIANADLAPQLHLHPQWSPEGSSLAYAAGKSIYVIDATGGEPREVAHLEYGWDYATVRWSPDGENIAAFGFPEPNSENAVFVVPASGGEPRQLTPVTRWLQRLEWHPDGTRLTYHVSMYNSETRQAYLDGRPPTLLLDVPGIWDYEGAWAPDGRQFFFLGDRGLYVYDETSGKTTFVADCGSTDEESVPTWSRDGKTMAWCATKATSPQIWVMENFEPAAPATQLPNPPTGNYFVTQSGDDAEEWGDGNMYLDSSDLELVHDDNNSRGDQVVGIRLADIRIPKGSHIKKAYVQFTTDEVSTKPTDLTIRAELTGNAKTFTTARSDISSRKRTKASVKWSPEPWNMTYERSDKQRTPDLSSLIQEVVDQPDWQEGNAIALIFTGSGRRPAVSFDDGGRHYGPMLHIEY